GGLVIIAYIFSQHLVALFITSPEVMEITETLLHIVLWSTVLFGFASVLSGMMRASGDVIIPMLLSLACIILVELPVAIYLSNTPLGLGGIWWGYAASFTTMLVLQGAYYWFWWKNKPIKRLI
ncbi:MAG TPA: MATE family efflux transporter, partial [Devosia sp.]|nr:MATE family efflux transporter [Devosia sp.]